MDKQRLAYTKLISFCCFFALFFNMDVAFLQGQISLLRMETLLMSPAPCQTPLFVPMGTNSGVKLERVRGEMLRFPLYLYPIFINH